MNNPTKPRLSDVAKQNTTDRTSKLVSGFMPRPAVTPESELATETSEVADTTIEPVEATKTEVQKPLPKIPSKAKPERVKRGAAPVDFIELITQALPNGIKCDRPIMLAGDHHELLREFSFTQKKPMTEILYNLLEYATQAYQREQQKHV